MANTFVVQTGGGRGIGVEGLICSVRTEYKVSFGGIRSAMYCYVAFSIRVIQSPAFPLQDARRFYSVYEEK
jgi:hypothetical protein